MVKYQNRFLTLFCHFFVGYFLVFVMSSLFWFLFFDNSSVSLQLSGATVLTYYMELVLVPWLKNMRSYPCGWRITWQSWTSNTLKTFRWYRSVFLNRLVAELCLVGLQAFLILLKSLITYINCMKSKLFSYKSIKKQPNKLIWTQLKAYKRPKKFNMC